MLFNLSAPKISLLYAGIMGIFYFLLSVNVINQRRKKLVGLGHDSDPRCPLFRSVRIHGNFNEYVPLILLLLVLDEVTGRNKMVLHFLGTLLVLGRIGHFIGITKSHKTSAGRFIGTIMTFVCLITLSVFLVTKGLS
ncbi:MAG: MAPEG family protein [Bacteriovoracia bacterium]